METERAGQILTAGEIFDLVREDLQQVEKAIDVESVASVETVTTIGKYLQQSGGKRLRPALLLLCARFAGGGGKSAVQLGAVVEMLHAATLVHDDVIDVAQTRVNDALKIVFGAVKFVDRAHRHFDRMHTINGRTGVLIPGLE